jgi:hypothetical protein
VRTQRAWPLARRRACAPEGVLAALHDVLAPAPPAYSPAQTDLLNRLGGPAQRGNCSNQAASANKRSCLSNRSLAGTVRLLTPSDESGTTFLRPCKTITEIESQRQIPLPPLFGIEHTPEQHSSPSTHLVPDGIQQKPDGKQRSAPSIHSQSRMHFCIEFRAFVSQCSVQEAPRFGTQQHMLPGEQSVVSSHTFAFAHS